MNIHYDIPEESQYQFLYGTIQKRNRSFNKMVKKIDDSDLELVSRVFFINKSKGQQILDILTEEQLAELRLEYYKGGE